MLAPVSWITEYVEGGSGKDDVAERMTMSGSAVEGVKTFGDGSVTGIVLGQVGSVNKHPDSDHLLICTARAGAEDTIQIVTGAQNMKSGDYVPVALNGAVLPGGVKIKTGKLRGEVSEGMFCSAQELGFDDKVVPLACKDGIWVLPEEVRREEDLGKDIFEALGLKGEQVFDFEITPNRPDCLSVCGLAAEYAAAYDLPLESFLNHPAGKDINEPAIDAVTVKIQKPEHCSRYVARVAEDVVIKESPWWIQKRLMLAGMRPINNIVDITNYVMLELGHPIHAFDIREISGGEINVDVAKEGEKFTTLDGATRTLDGNMLLIKDGARGVAIAGVMGGENSEIKEDTKAILIEAASFSADSVRRTSKKLDVRTEASSRFEKGVPAELSRIAADRVCELITMTDSGTVIPGAADCYPVKQEVRDIEVRAGRVNAVLGTSLSLKEIAGALMRLGVLIEEKEETLSVRAPFTRLDLKEEIDIIEEVARIYGYDKLETTMHADKVMAGVSGSWALRRTLRELLTGLGLSEIQTYSFVSPAGVSLIGAGGDAEENNFVKLINPLGEENSVMRTTLLPGLIEALQRNYNFSAKDCRLFEIGNTFKNVINEEGLPTEALSLCAGAYGAGAGFFYMKGVIERIFEKIGLGEPVFEETTVYPTFHPGRCAQVKSPDQHTGDGSFCVNYGVFGELHPDVCARLGIEERVCCFELNYDLLAERANQDRLYKPLPKYPAVLRDIALLAENGQAAGELLGIIRRRGGRILDTAELFDVYRGQQVPEGKKSMAFGLAFRDAEKTLTDEEVQKVMIKILKGLEEEAGAVLRK